MKRQRYSDDEDDDSMPSKVIRNGTRTLSTLFNSDVYSDCKLQFPNSNTTLHLHKAIICPQSDFFRVCFASGMQESSDSTIQADENDDEYHLTLLIRSLYSMELKLKDTQIITALIMAEKYQITEWIELLTNYLTKNLTQKNIFECFTLNLDNYTQVRDALEWYLQKNYDEILTMPDLLELELEQFKMVLDAVTNEERKKLVAKLVHKWVNIDSTTRSTNRQALLQFVDKETKPRQVFLPEHCSTHARLSSDKSQVQKVDGEKGSNCFIFATQCTSFKVRMGQKCEMVRIGFAKLSKSCDSRLDFRGYCLRVQNGNAIQNIQQLGEQINMYTGQCNAPGTVIEARIMQNMIRFLINGEDRGVAFRKVTEDLYPVVCLYHVGASLDIIK